MSLGTSLEGSLGGKTYFVALPFKHFETEVFGFGLFVTFETFECFEIMFEARLDIVEKFELFRFDKLRFETLALDTEEGKGKEGKTDFPTIRSDIGLVVFAPVMVWT